MLWIMLLQRRDWFEFFNLGGTADRMADRTTRPAGSLSRAKTSALRDNSRRGRGGTSRSRL